MSMDAELTADDMPALPPCTCIDMGDGTFISNACLQHDPVLGCLVEQPVQFTGLLSVLDAAKDRDHRA